MGNQFDWGSVDRKGIVLYLKKISKLITSEPISTSNYYDIVTAHLKRKYPILVKKNYRARILKGKLSLGGLYHWYDDQIDKKSIQLLFYFNSKDDYLEINLKRFTSIAKLIADTILHEVIHMRQYRQRNYKSLPSRLQLVHCNILSDLQKYYGHRDEIDAYSFNIACELLDYCRTQSAAKTLLECKFDKSITIADTLKQYVNVFDKNCNHPVIKILKKRIIKSLPYAALGKPFKRAPELKSR